MPTHDFSRLSSFDFEEFVCDLIQAEWRTRLEIFTAGRDSGIDLRAFTDSKRETIIQCKHMPGSTFRKLLAQLRKDELPKIKTLAPSRYVLVTSLGLTPANKKSLVTLLHPYLKRQKDIIARNELNALLRRHPKVETSNFKLWLTSTAVLQRVLRNAEHSQTEFEVERVRKKLPLFVQNNAFPRAQQLLNEGRVVVVSGVPGIGKTTLADMLLFAHLEQGFEPVVIQDSIDEAKRVFSRAAKQIFYFDDFLGETFLHDRPDTIARNQDAALISFMEAVRSSKASRFILTTREHILKKALNVSERFGNSAILDQRCILELSDYSFAQKARILYNHLYFSDLPNSYKQAVLEEDFYFKIIRHQNFNPRLIEWLSGYVRVKGVSPENYREHIKQLLDSPERIWSHAFEHQITESARSLLFSICTGSYGHDMQDLEPMWQALHQHKSAKYNFATSPRDFRRALSDLEGSFIKIDETRVDFLNPSIRDFIENLIRDHKEYVVDLVESASLFSQITSVYQLAEERSSPELHDFLAPAPTVLASLKRLVKNPHVRWTVGADGRYQGTYFDTTPEGRLRTLIQWADASESEALLEVINLAHENLANEWKQFSVNIVRVIGILEELERRRWVYGKTGAALHRTLLDKVLSSLNHASHYEWKTLMSFQGKSKLWTGQDTDAFKDALHVYRSQGVLKELQGCDDLSQLEHMKGSLKDMQKEHRISFRSVLKKIDAGISAMGFDPDDDTSETYSSVRSPNQKHEPDNEDEVRRLFESLIL